MRKAVQHLKQSDPVLRAIMERVGAFKMNYDEPQFPSLAEAIVYQQLHDRAAATIFKRLTNLAGLPLTPEGILKLSEAQMRGAGLSKQKLSYLRDLAAKTKSGELDFTRLPEMSDEEVIKHLTSVKGIGVWTAHMFLMFALRRPNVLPTGDYGVQMAMFKHYFDVRRAKAASGKSAKKGRKRKIKLPKPAQMEKIAKCWEPYRSVACWYLWRSLDIKAI